MAREKIERSGDAASDAPRAALSVAELRQIISMMNGSDIEEIGIEEVSTGLKLSLRKSVTTGFATTVDDDTDHQLPDQGDGAVDSSLVVVSSPLVGFFRVGMAPGAKPLTAMDDVVRAGQVLGAIESLNVFNEVEAPAAGRIREIYVNDGQAVEYGQPLLAVEPFN